MNSHDYSKIANNIEYRCINVILDFIVKYKAVPVDCLTAKSEIIKLYNFIRNIGKEEIISEENELIFHKIMKYIGFG